LKGYEITRREEFRKYMPVRLRNLGGIRDGVIDELIGPLRKQESLNAAACKAAFDLTSDCNLDQATLFGMRLWQASSDGPLYRADWRSLDSYLMLSDFVDIATTKSKLVDHPYAQLACYLSQMDFRSVPIAVTQGARVIVGGRKVEFGLFLSVHFHGSFETG